MILDVGCGNRPSGNINIDIYKDNSPEASKIPFNKKISNFILASGCYLPFKNEIFDTIISDNSMEHVNDYLLFLKEMLRVTKNEIIIKVPHRFTNKRINKYHKQHFTQTWFKKTLIHLGFTNFLIFISRYNYYPHTFLPLIKTPREIKVLIYKKRRILK